MKENELLSAWNDAVAELTPEERETLARGTTKDWVEAIAECAADPAFWSEIGSSFLQGLVRGLENR